MRAPSLTDKLWAWPIRLADHRILASSSAFRLVVAVLLSAFFYVTAAPATSAELLSAALPPPGPFTAQLVLDTVPGHPHEVRVRKIILHAVGGAFGFGAGRPSEAGFNCEPCRGGPAAQVEKKTTGNTIALIEHLKIHLYSGSTFHVFIHRYGYFTIDGQREYLDSERVKVFKVNPWAARSRLVTLSREFCSVVQNRPEEPFPCPSTWDDAEP